MKQYNSISLKNPFYGISLDTILLGLYFLVLPFDFIGSDFGSITKLMALLPVGFTLLCNVIRNMKINMYLLIIFVLYYVMNYVSVLWAPIPIWAEQRAETLILNYLMIIICTSVPKTSKEILFLEKSIVASIVWILLFVGFNSTSSINGRLFLDTGNYHQDPNYLCGFLIFPILYLVKKLIAKKNKFFSVLMIMLMLYIIFLTGSRGGLLALIFALFAYFICQEGKNMSTKIIALTIVSFLILVAIMLFVPDEIMQRYNLSYTLNDGAAGRFDIWKELWKKHQNFDIWQKWFGVGANNVRYFSFNHKVAHNLWIETLIELGIFGLVGLILIHSYFIMKSWKSKDKLYFATLIGYEVMTMSMSLYTYKPLFAIFLMINLVRFELPDKSETLQQPNIFYGVC